MLLDERWSGHRLVKFLPLCSASFLLRSPSPLFLSPSIFLFPLSFTETCCWLEVRMQTQRNTSVLPAWCSIVSQKPPPPRPTSGCVGGVHLEYQARTGRLAVTSDSALHVQTVEKGKDSCSTPTNATVAWTFSPCASGAREARTVRASMHFRPDVSLPQWVSAW